MHDHPLYRFPFWHCRRFKSFDWLPPNTPCNHVTNYTEFVMEAFIKHTKAFLSCSLWFTLPVRLVITNNNNKGSSYAFFLLFFFKIILFLYYQLFLCLHLWTSRHVIAKDAKSVTIERANEHHRNCIFDHSKAKSWLMEIETRNFHKTFRTINRTFTMIGTLPK